MICKSHCVVECVVVFKFAQNVCKTIQELNELVDHYEQQHYRCKPASHEDNEQKSATHQVNARENHMKAVVRTTSVTVCNVSLMRINGERA